ncbi:DCL family protein [Streptomyces sp. NPDC085529]|uniref:DCL family protein n=1 Tax=Streptomyces sp. NPDC085529 TaxID=3365729 RepID=UPI0037CFA811
MIHLPYTIGTETFRVKDEITRRCVEIRDKYQFLTDKTVSNSNEDDFLRALLRRHPEAETKIRGGVDHFEVDKDPTWDTYCFWAVDEEGERVKFSYPHIITSLRPD